MRGGYGEHRNIVVIEQVLSEDRQSLPAVYPEPTNS